MDSEYPGLLDAIIASKLEEQEKKRESEELFQAAIVSHTYDEQIGGLPPTVYQLNKVVTAKEKNIALSRVGILKAKKKIYSAQIELEVEFSEIPLVSDATDDIAFSSHLV